MNSQSQPHADANNTAEPTPDLVIDASGLACPMPLLKAKQGLNRLESGQILEVRATDPGAERDIPAFCSISGHKLLQVRAANALFSYWLQKR
ncbi:sulfurtransferase TusA family protein [Simiduia sp. 21SJ11W-1]|uniref:sulfurtransferase TusA family protein n=1 Tax=Simiduia sp. 21SJ11W-1 TaxID=2909669 RepID=UPI00209DF1C2|nr:sulfurtransferase TusA family protein [Simiduia sp. 21SJ11W-1]UTA46813.1 sulfurtransferase TusA family protein [Simiduia sp. 21SJ11W-1]